MNLILLFHTYNQFFQHCLLNIAFFLIVFKGIYHILNKLQMYLISSLHSSPHTCLFLCQNQTVLILVISQYFLISCCKGTQITIFLKKLAFYANICLYITFRINLSGPQPLSSNETIS